MSGDHGHDHGHGHGASSAKRLLAALVLAASFMAVEVVGGLYTGSLALLADAGHMASDAGALALALGAIWLAKRQASERMSFGNHRAEVLAALVNGVALLVIAGFVIKEAVERWGHPPEVLAGPMLLIAAGGLVVNLLALWILSGGHKDSLNVRAAFLHVVADALGSVGAMVSGALIWAFDWRWADPAASVFIAVAVLVSAGLLLRRTIAVLMVAVPEGLVLGELREAAAAVDGVVELHDVHAWTLTSGKNVLTAHLVAEPADWRPAITGVRRLLMTRFDLAHVTLQPEVPSDGPCGCDLHAAASSSSKA